MTDPIQQIQERLKEWKGYHPYKTDIQNLLKLVKAIKNANNEMDDIHGMMIDIGSIEKEIFGEK